MTACSRMCFRPNHEFYLHSWLQPIVSVESESQALTLGKRKQESDTKAQKSKKRKVVAEQPESIELMPHYIGK